MSRTRTGGHRTRPLPALCCTPRPRPGPPRHDIEVFDQLPPLPDGWSEAGPVGRTPATPVAPPTSPSRPDRSAIWPVLVLGVAGLALLVAAVLLLTG